MLKQKMKNARKLILLLALAFSLQPLALPAGVLIGTLSPITTASTNSSTFVTNTAILVLPNIYLANNGLAITNAYTGFFRWSFDNTTFYTNGSPAFIPTATNAASYVISAQAISVPIYIQLLAVTNTANTVTINIGASTP